MQLLRRHRTNVAIVNFGGCIGRLFGFCRITAVVQQDGKADLCRQWAFLGLDGSCPCPDSVAILSVTLTEEKKSLCVDRLGEFLRTGHIMRRELESATGRLSFSQTSVLGRFGRGITQPLYRKLNAPFYQSVLSDAGRKVSQWRAAMIRGAKPRRSISRNPIPDKNYLYGFGRGNHNLGHRRFRQARFRLRGFYPGCISRGCIGRMAIFVF